MRAVLPVEGRGGCGGGAADCGKAKGEEAEEEAGVVVVVVVDEVVPADPKGEEENDGADPPGMPMGMVTGGTKVWNLGDEAEVGCAGCAGCAAVVVVGCGGCGGCGG